MSKYEWLKNVDPIDVLLLTAIVILGITGSFGAGWLIFFLFLRH
jgi:hypothetical protein